MKKVQLMSCWLISTSTLIVNLSTLGVISDPIIFRYSDENFMKTVDRLRQQSLKRNLQEQSESSWITTSTTSAPTYIKSSESASIPVEYVEILPLKETTTTSPPAILNPVPPAILDAVQPAILDSRPPLILDARPSSISDPVPSVSIDLTQSELVRVGGSCNPSSNKTQCTVNSACLPISLFSDENSLKNNYQEEFACICDEHFVKNENGVCVRHEGSPCHYMDNECNQQSTHLNCINSKCTCEQSDSYNSFTKKCEGKVGGTCFEGKKCIGNAHCMKTYSFDTIGICECQVGYVESVNSICLKAYGRTCYRNEECDGLNLICREGYCKCRNSLQKFDFRTQSCVSLVGAKCTGEDWEGSSSKSCVDGAYCKVINKKLAGRCTCMANLVQSEVRTCIPVSSWMPVAGYQRNK